jgi:drug/metabolite transporter (DMT)-like permease
MSPAAIGLVLFAAVLHASWNAVLRSGVDRLWTVTMMSFATTVAAIPFAFLLPLPQAGSWIYLIASAVLQVVYSVFLAYAYRHGELGQVYPLVRGSVPLLVTLGGFVLAGQQPGWLGLLGVGLISLGVISLAFGKRSAAPKSVALALATGAFIACYVTADGLGVRQAGNARAYAAWIFLVYGALMPLAFLLLRGKFEFQLRTPESLKALAAGIVSLLSYASMTSALALGSIGAVSALRETSVVFSILIGRFALQESLTGRRLLVCIAVVAGALCLGYQH